MSLPRRDVTDDEHDKQPTQKTQPKKGRPIDIPVPKREDIERLLTKAARGEPKS